MKSRVVNPGFALGGTIATLLLLVRCSAGATILIDDFNDRNDDGWTHAPRTGGPAVWDTTSGDYFLESVGAVTGPNGVAASYWNDSFDPEYRDGYLRARVRANNPQSVAVMYLRIADPQMSEAWKFYFFIADPVDGRLGIGRFNGSAGSFPPTGVAQQSVPTGFTWGEDWIMEAGAIGDQLSFKAWRVGEPEPDVPQLIALDATHSSGGFGLDAGVAVNITANPSSVTFDDIFFNVIPPCDFNRDGLCNIHDLKSSDRGLYSVGDLSLGTGSRSIVQQFDVTEDNFVDVDDLRQWLTEAASHNGLAHPYLAGDASLDGTVAFEDFLVLAHNFSLGKRDWSHGDFDGNPEVDFADFLALAANFGISPSTQFAAVPEANSCLLLFIGLNGYWFYRIRRV